MPKNRQQIPREERSDELLAVATELFLQHGYDGTTMAAISAAAGVAPANVYWYFPSKDDIFAAVMDRRLGREMRALEHELREVDALSALLRGLSDMRAFRSLHYAMHARMLKSSAVRESHEKFLAWVRGNVARAVDERGGAVDKEMFCDVAVALFEGANVYDGDTRPAHDMIIFLFESMFDERGRRSNATR